MRARNNRQRFSTARYRACAATNTERYIVVGLSVYTK
jgi:hypothetical protein